MENKLKIFDTFEPHNFILIVFGVTVALAPLQNFFISFFLGQGSNWNALNPFIFLFICVGYGTSLFYKKINLNRSTVLISVTCATAFLLINLLSKFSVPLSQLTPILLIIFSLPLLDFLTRSRIAHPSFLTGLAALILHSQWALLQFIFQHSLGFLGEPFLEIGMPAVATFSAGEKVLRAYGPYPHPNIFAGILSLIFPAVFILNTYMYQSIYKRYSQIILLFLFLILLLTFSRSALLSIGTTACLYAARYIRHFKFSYIAIPYILIFLIISPLYLARTSDSADQAIGFRSETMKWSVNILREHISFNGIGYGNYTNVLTQYLSEQHIAYQQWEVAPLHFVPVLLLIELGYIPFILIFGITLFLLYRYRQLYLLIVALLPLIFLDHYLYTYSVALFWLMYVGLYIVHNSSNIFSFSKVS